MLPLSRLGCPLSLKTPNMGNPGSILCEATPPMSPEDRAQLASDVRLDRDSDPLRDSESRKAVLLNPHAVDCACSPCRVVADVVTTFTHDALVDRLE